MANLTRRPFDGALRRQLEDMSLKDASCCPCCNPAQMLASELSIDSYSDGDITPCSSCDTDFSSRPYFDGTFQADHDTSGAGLCRWIHTGSAGGYRIEDKVMSSATIQFDDEERYFILAIVCDGNFGPPFGGTSIWRGTKASYFPSGVYARLDGCDATSSLTVLVT